MSSELIKNKALIVEDESAIAELLKINLMQMNIDVDVCSSAESALELLNVNKYELCLLDWMLPQMQGIDFLKKINKKQIGLKIIMITAKSDTDSIVQGLDSGADDYLTKPFDSKVLAARVRNILKSIEPKHSTLDEMSIEGLNINFLTYKVNCYQQELNLTHSEFKLLAALVKAQGKVLTRDQLILLIQGEDVSVTGRTIDTHVFALRKKLGLWSKHIETIRGVGYRLLISLTDASEADASEPPE